MGRPTKLTRKVKEAYCAAISTGCTLEMAAAYAGVSYDTTNNWYQAGKGIAARIKAGDPAPEKGTPELRYLQFFEAAEQARLEAGIRWQQVVDAAANTTPDWAFRMLTVRFGQDYKPPPAEQQISGNLGVAVTGLDEALNRIYGDDKGNGADGATNAT